MDAMADVVKEVEGGIVVGYDGSPAAAEAVRWAADLAVELGSPLHVVRSWSITTAPRPKSMEPGYVPPLDEFAAAVREELEGDLAEMGLPEGCEVRCHAVHGQSSQGLLKASAGARMLVVGSRGAGGFRGLVFGSTADQVVRYSTVPVVVVPIGRD
jgi:nucleotide-binding universal stress UspA family protein